MDKRKRGNGKKFTYVLYQDQNRKSNTKTVAIDNSGVHKGKVKENIEEN